MPRSDQVALDHVLLGSPDRLAELHALGILDTHPEEGFDDIASIAALICGAPVALVSLVSSDRQWFKAAVGVEMRESDIPSSVCAHALGEGDLLIIPDLSSDARTRRNPLVAGEPHIRFYAGAPLRMPSGQTMGSLCVLDIAPRPEGLTAEQRDGLRRLGRRVVALLAGRRQLAHALGNEEQLKRAFDRQIALTELGDKLRDLSSSEEMTCAGAELVGRVLGASCAGFSELDASRAFADVVGTWSAVGRQDQPRRFRLSDYGAESVSTLSRGKTLVVDAVETDVRTAEAASVLKRLDIGSMIVVPVNQTGRPPMLLFAYQFEARTWRPEEIAFARNVADRMQVGVARLRAEDHQRTLNDELSHRMKNVLTLVQAIAQQTMRNAVDLQTARDALNARLVTLGKAHDLLLAGRTEAATLEAVIRSALTVNDDRQFTIAGPPLSVGSKAALSLSLTFHELMTNAAKYGALLSPDGHVSIEWTLDRAEGETWMRLRWCETGGPVTEPPARRGFGSRLIERALSGVFRGTGTMSYLPTGLVCELVAPLSGLQADS